MYSDKLLTYFYHTPHQGVLDVSEKNVYQAEVGLRENEEVLQLSVLICDNRVKKSCFKAVGSVGLIAGAECLCALIEGELVDVIQQMTLRQLQEITELPDEKIHTAQLILKAVKQCLTGQEGVNS